MKTYDVGVSEAHRTVVDGKLFFVAHAVGRSRWPWGRGWRALCGQQVIRTDRPFKPGGRAACADCSRYAAGIRARSVSTG